MSERANGTGLHDAPRHVLGRGPAVAVIVLAVVLAIVATARWALAQETNRTTGKVASALILVDKNPDERMEDHERFLATMAVLARSPNTFRQALANDPGIVKGLADLGQNDPVRWLSDSVRVENLARTSFLQVSCVAQNPELAVRVANTMMGTIIKDFRDVYNEQLVARLHQNEEERTEAARAVDMLRESFRARMKSSPDAFASGTTPGAAAEALRDVCNELRRVRLERKAAEVRLARQKSSGGANSVQASAQEEAVAVLAGQEDLLRRDEQAAIETVMRAEAARLDLKAYEDSLARSEAWLRSIEDQIRRAKSQLRLPRISQKSQAHITSG